MGMMATGGDPLVTPGFRFYPTEEELLSFYLRHRLAGTRADVERFIPVVDIYRYHPRDLQAMAGAANVSDTEQWFFFCPRTEREVHGGRPVRTTPSGYWKATGSPSGVVSSSADRVLGEKRTMVFYEGRAPTGTKTPWKMNEYKAVADAAVPGPVADAVNSAPIKLRNEFSVCRVYKSNGTLRSFDRRPLNPAGHNQAAVHHQQQQFILPSTMNTTNQLADVIAKRQTTENSYDSCCSGSRGAVIHGTDDTAIDWESLIPLLRN